MMARRISDRCFEPGANFRSGFTSSVLLDSRRPAFGLLLGGDESGFGLNVISILDFQRSPGMPVIEVMSTRRTVNCSILAEILPCKPR